LAVGIKRVIDDSFGRVLGVVVLVTEMPKSFSDGFEAGTFGLMVERVVRIGAVDNPSEQNQRGIACQLVFFRIASNEHSLPWWPSLTFFTS